MRQIVLVLILMLFGSAPAWAGGSNPDQLNVDSTFFSTSPDGAASNTAQITNSGNENDADGDAVSDACDVCGLGDDVSRLIQQPPSSGLSHRV